MDPVRDVVWGEVQRGKVEVTQKGEMRDYEGRKDIRGPIRVRRGPRWEQTGNGAGQGGDDHLVGERGESTKERDEQ